MNRPVRNTDKLAGVDHDLIGIFMAGALDFTRRNPYFISVAWGVRSERQQREMVAAGLSQTMHSYHRRGRAIDAYIYTHDGEIVEDGDIYAILNQYIQNYADVQRFPITWGGHWKMRDYGHWQIEKKV